MQNFTKLMKLRTKRSIIHLLLFIGETQMNEIIEKVHLNPTVTKMVVKDEKIASKAKAGQFIILRVDVDGERIPLTIADTDSVKGTVTLIFQIVGATTFALNQLNVGEHIHDLVGPLGKASELEGLKKVIVVGGGVGCAIAFPIVKALHEQGSHVTSITGFRNRDLVILEDEFKQYSDTFYLMSDDGSAGEKGLVTDCLKRLLEVESVDAVIAIGPLVMMKFVCLTTKPFNTKTIVSMNPIMVDGTGMCGGCRINVGGEMKFACVDGPDFDGHLVDFDEVMARSRTYKEYEENCNLLAKGDHHE